MGLFERVEHHRLIDAVEELRSEVAGYIRHHFGLNRRLECAAIRSGIIFLKRLADMHCAQVRRHHHHGVAEIHRSALAVGQSPIFQHLQQNIEDIRMRLFDLIQ